MSHLFEITVQFNQINVQCTIEVTVERKISFNKKKPSTFNRTRTRKAGQDRPGIPADKEKQVNDNNTVTCAWRVKRAEGVKQ